MVFIRIFDDKNKIYLDCNKNTPDGENFKLVIDRNTLQVIEKPQYPSMDVSVAYSHIYMLLREGSELPYETVAEWG